MRQPSAATDPRFAARRLPGRDSSQPGKVECQAVRMLKHDHLVSHQVSERDLHIDTVSTFGDR
jgi:hypothetical protein